MGDKGSDLSNKENVIQINKKSSYNNSESTVDQQPISKPNTRNVPVASASKQSIVNQQSNSIKTNPLGKMSDHSNAQCREGDKVNNPTNVAQTSKGVETITNHAIILSGVSNVSDSTKQAVSFYRNKKLSNSEFINAGRAVAARIEGELLSSDDLGVQTMGGMYEGVKLSATAFKASQVVVNSTPQVVKTGIETTKKVYGGVNIVGKGVYEVGLQAGLTTIAVTQAYSIVKGAQIMPISKDAMRILRATSVTSGLSQTAISQKMIQTATSIQTGVVHSVNAVKSIVPNVILIGHRLKKRGIATATVAANTAKFAYGTVKGVMSGTLSVSFVAYQMEQMAKREIGKALVKISPLIQKGAYSIVRGTAVGAKWAALKGLPTGVKVLRGGIVTTSSMFSGSDNYVLRGVANTIQTADIATRVGAQTIKTGVSVGKSVGKMGIKTAKTSIKTAKAVIDGAVFWSNFVKANGVKRMLVEAGHKIGKGIGKGIAHAGKSMVSLAINLIKMLGKKFIIPLLLILFIASGGVTVISAPIMVVGSFFSGIFGTSDTGEEFEVQAFLADTTYGIPVYSSNTKQELADKMIGDWKSQGGEYDIVRLKNPDGTGAVVEPTLAGVSAVFYTDVEIVQILQPIFNAIILMDYDLEPTLQESKDLLRDMYNKIFTITVFPTTEYCGQNLITGEGAATPCYSCGEIHALDDCPHFTQGYHTSVTCAECCELYYVCNGHKGSRDCGESSHTHSSSCYTETDGVSTLTCDKSQHTHSSWVSASNSGCYSTDYCSGGGEMLTPCSNSTEYFRCKGYKICDGHEVNTYEITLDGLYPLIYDYFLEPIDTLSSITSRTKEQEEQLQNLKDYYEIFQIMMTQVSGGAYGGSLTVDELKAIQWATSTRQGNEDVVNLATSQATPASVGGAVYWSYYGFSSRVEWCACFVHWCMRNTPTATNCYPTTSNNAYCQTVANEFSALGQFKSNTEYGNITKGDVIFLDWQADGHTDHVGIVIGRDDEFVYTVEGNSGDSVKIKKYDLNSNVIYGYAYMNY